VIFLYDEVGVVLAQLKESVLGNFKKLLLDYFFVSVGAVPVEGVDVYEQDGDEPKESEGVELKVREEGKSEHLQKILVLRFGVGVIEAGCEGRKCFVYLGLKLFHIINQTNKS